MTSLQRQTSGSSVLAENLKKFQLQLEQSNSEEKKRLQVTCLLNVLIIFSSCVYQDIKTGARAIKFGSCVLLDQAV